jgi:kynurenine 3-monooxygenase
MLPQVAIAGGGPAGLLLALLLGRRGLDVTVFEKERVIDNEWTARSYAISLNERGQKALRVAGVFDAVRESSCIKNALITRMSDGSENVIPREPPQITITRPDLMACLRDQVQKEGKAKLKYEAPFNGAIRRNKDNSDLFELDLEDGSRVLATHIIAADGKWSAVRGGVAALEKLEGCTDALECKSHSEPSWGVLLHMPQTPPGWRKDALYLLVPATLRNHFYAVCSPLADGLCSASLVFFDSILATHPWINARAEDEASQPWSGHSIGADPAWRARMAALLAAELPALAAAATPAVLAAAVQNRRASWVEVAGRLHLLAGRAALVGDAAHAMTASRGEGCNCALESAVLLDAAVGDAAAAAAAGGPLGLAELSGALARYGDARAGEVRPVQLASAAANRASPFRAG